MSTRTLRLALALGFSALSNKLVIYRLGDECGKYGKRGKPMSVVNL